MKQTLIVPTELSEITLGQMQTFYADSEKLDEVERNKLALRVFCGANHRWIEKIPQKALKNALLTLSNTLNEKPEFENRFVLNGTQYGFAPNLDELTFGEFVDLQKYQADFNQLHHVMAILFRPITSEHAERYSIASYTGTEDAEAMKEMPLSVALGAKVFFWDLGNALVSSILSSLTEEDSPTPSNNRSRINGGGTERLSDYAKTILEGLKLSQPYPSIKF